MPRKSKSKPVSRREVKKMLAANTELKHLGKSVTQSPSTTGAFTLLNGLAQGVGNSQRVSAEQKNVRLLLHGTMTFADATNTVRMIVFQDRDHAQGVAIADYDILANSGSVCSQRNFLNRKRFRIFHDKIYTLADGSDQIRSFSIDKRVSCVTRYGSTGATASDILDNPIYVFLQSDSAAASHPLVCAYSQLHYTDA